MRRDEDWFDAVGKDEWRNEQIELSEKYPEHVGKWILTGPEGEVVQVRSEPFAFAKLVKFNFPQLPAGHPNWENPPF